MANAQVFLAGQPAADGFLDLDAGRAEFVRPQLFQVSHLSGPEEDLCFSELVFIFVL